MLFLAADYDSVSRLRDLAKTYLAWHSIVEDINNETLVLDIIQVKQAKKQKDDAHRAVKQMLHNTYKWLIAPSAKAENSTVIMWEAVSISSAASNLILEVENTLKEEDWVTVQWSPVHLLTVLKSWYFKSDKTEINALKVWQDSCCYLYLPRLLNSSVFEQAITEGLKTQDYFGYASAKDGEQYLGFVLGGSSLVHLNNLAILIEKETAKAYLKSITPIEPPLPPDTKIIDPNPKPNPDPNPTPTKVVKTQFHASIDLDPVKAKMDFSVIVDEVIQHFTAKLGVNVQNVKISVEIESSAEQGFDETTQRIVKENCKVLKFNHSEFEA